MIMMLINTSFHRCYVYLGFELNREHITENLCDNRSRPELKCNGKCYLMQKLKQADENKKNRIRKISLEI